MSTESRKGIELKIASLVQALSKPSASALARYERNAAGSKAPSAKVCGMATARRVSELITTSCTLTTVHRGPQHQCDGHRVAALPGDHVLLSLGSCDRHRPRVGRPAARAHPERVLPRFAGAAAGPGLR